MATTVPTDRPLPRSAGPASAKWLFVATILTGSFLLFLMQPMVARMALPRLGGAPAVWNSAMLVYQALLLGGYAYAHWLGGRAPRWQGAVHVALFAVAAIWLPVGLAGFAAPSGASVVFWVPWLLLASIGPLFFVVSAQAPLMQRWYALSGEEGEPYALYAASNFGSFGGLIAYPLLIEPFFTLRAQSWIWTGLYALVALLVVACALTLRGRSAVAAVAVEEAVSTPAPDWRTRARWVLLAAVPSGLMLSTTTHLTTDLIAMPLIWAIPLGLYLLSFTVAFAANQAAAGAIRFLSPLIVLVAGGFSFMGAAGNPAIGLGASIILLFTVAVTLHNAMYRTRPDPQHLTAFYLMMSVGGACGGLFCAIVAPALFDWTWEHPILIIGAALLVPQTKLVLGTGDLSGEARLRRIGFLFAALAALALALLLAQWLGGDGAGRSMLLIAIMVFAGVMLTGYRPAFAAGVAALMLANGGSQAVNDLMEGARTRSYFGIYTVRQNATQRWLAHGTTIHGLQIFGTPMLPASYYGPRSGVGQAFLQASRTYGPAARLGVVGLGTGTLACYRRPGMALDYFEIDPAMVGIARDRHIFSFLERCAPQARIHIGDARLTLQSVRAHGIDLLAIDAFSSDAIPMHLLTREAFDVYDRALSAEGTLLVHISNRYIDLEPVIAAEAAARGWSAAIRLDYVSDTNTAAGFRSSKWIALTRRPAQLARLTGPLAPKDRDPRTIARAVWQPLEARPGQPRWSDDYASVMPLLSLRRMID